MIYWSVQSDGDVYSVGVNDVWIRRDKAIGIERDGLIGRQWCVCRERIRLVCAEQRETVERQRG